MYIHESVAVKCKLTNVDEFAAGKNVNKKGWKISTFSGHIIM